MLNAIIAAALFGASAPISKLLLNDISPVFMASFLYLGSGVGLLVFKLFQKASKVEHNEARISKTDIPWLIGAILTGGILAPVVLMFSLQNTPASTASLLLNFESVATTVIAVLFFREHISKRVLVAMILITIASIVLSWNTSGNWGFSIAAFGVILACIFWGMDNNFTRNISLKDPVSIAMIKGLSAGSFSFILALSLHNPMPAMDTIIYAMILGSLSYGISVVLFIKALRELGSVRTGALFGAAPFIGAVLSFFLFREAQGVSFYTAIVIMIIGVMLLLREKHEHSHTHEESEHEHRHGHDDGHHTHQHENNIDIPEGAYHSHRHKHSKTKHKHPHKPDIHHRHSH